ncbi:MAG TPA: alpha/beta fold hydrolase [Gemmatimonadaceae bacterium]|nr:alpha/beta fold hydrolase [Gemmatimonadaceae bacterium]
MPRAIFFSIIALSACAPVSARPPVTPIRQCTKALVACQRWVTLGGGPGRSMVYSNYALDGSNPAITRALVMVHGAGRNADHYFETAMAAGFLAEALGNTIIIAPRFPTGEDKIAPNELLWPARGDTWRSGGMSPPMGTVSAFDFMDQILRKLADRRTFPNLTRIVVAGHSAGGQFANRYGMSNKVDGTLRDVSISYVVANPSSYAWPTALRPLPSGDADSATAAKAPLGPDGEKVHTQYTFAAFDSTKAPTFNNWPAGLRNRTGYTAQMSDDQLRKQLVERRTTYLLGQVDVLPLGGFDSSPNAMAQGPTRRARGEAFLKYVNETLGARHTAMIVSECGHNDRCIFTTNAVFPVIFPR